MKLMKAVICLLLALLCVPFAMAEETVVAMINGEPLYTAEYAQAETAMLYQYQLAGVDLTDPAAYAYVQDLALTYVIEQRLLLQDVQAQGCFELSAEEETWCAEQGHAAWERALLDVGEMLRQMLELPEGTDMSAHALSYAENLGVSEQTYVDEYRTQLAMADYRSWLLGGEGVSDEDVQAAYEARVAASEARFSGDAAAFEMAIFNGEEIWYRPAGYRRVLQILLPAEGESDEERLASVADQVARINVMLVDGEPFENLITLYGVDANFNDPAFFEVGYIVHPDSVLWEDAFVAAAFAPVMVEPGCWSDPFVSDQGVHILYYLGDVPGGPVTLTEDVHELLAAVLYEERANEAVGQRMDVLAEQADVVIY